MGLDKIIDFILQFILDFLPVFVVKEWQKSVVLRNGRIHRVKNKGMHLKIPFIDEPVTYVTVTTTMETPTQTLITKDGLEVTMQTVIKYWINDVVLHTTEIYDATDAISDITQGHVANEVNNHTYDECRDTTALGHTISKKVRAEVKKYGVGIESITFTNFIRTRNVRLFGWGE